MKAKYVKKLLNCSYGTIKNYAKVGKIKLKKILPNGNYDYDDESVYSLLGSFCTPKKTTNFILVVDKNENKHEYFVNDEIINQILVFLQKRA